MPDQSSDAQDLAFYRQVTRLPGKLERARKRLVHLEREAARLGLHDLLADPERRAD